MKENLKLGKIITIFISAPGKKELYNRLQKRVEAEEVIKKRLKLAKKELQFSRHYDYIIVNQDLTKTLKVLEAILLAEEYRR